MTLEERIEALEKKIGIYKSVPEEPIKKRWRAAPSGKYFYASGTGSIFVDKDDYTEADDDRHDRGIYFRTEEEVELYDKKRLITQKVKDIAMRLEEPTEDDWKNDGEISKYYLGYDYSLNIVDRLVTDSTFRCQGIIYCLDYDFVDICLKEIGVEDLKLILLDL